jgi:ribonucleoside-diphosphate reductase alpha chain
VNTSYNPEHFEDEKIPMSILLQHIIMFYKYGGKQLYYNNTYDGQGEIDIEFIEPRKDVQANFITTIEDEDDCDACTI